MFEIVWSLASKAFWASEWLLKSTYACEASKLRKVEFACIGQPRAKVSCFTCLTTTSTPLVHVYIPHGKPSFHILSCQMCQTLWSDFSAWLSALPVGLCWGSRRRNTYNSHVQHAATNLQRASRDKCITSSYSRHTFTLSTPNAHFHTLRHYVITQSPLHFTWHESFRKSSVQLFTAISTQALTILLEGLHFQKSLYSVLRVYWVLRIW